MNYSLNVKSSSIVHTLLSNCVKLLGKVQKLLIKCISYSVISKRIRVVSPKFYTARKNFTGPPVPTVPTNFKSAWRHKLQGLLSQWDGDDVWRIWRQGLLSRDNFLRSFPSKEAKMAAAHNFFPSWQIQIHTITNTLIHEYKQSQKRM